MATNAQAVLQDVADWFGLGRGFARNSAEQWEHLADEYYAETGFLRPGKDHAEAANLSDEEIRAKQRVWQAWADKRKEALFERVRAALLSSADLATAEPTDSEAIAVLGAPDAVAALLGVGSQTIKAWPKLPAKDS